VSRSRHKGREPSRAVQAWNGYLRGEGVAPGPVTGAVDAATDLVAGTSDVIPEVTGDVAEALAAALGADGKIDVLVRCCAEGGRDLAKAARRALHAQRRRGADVPRARGRGAAPLGTSPQDPHADARAYITAPFGDGDRILLFRFRSATDRVLYAAMASLTDEHGLRDLQLYRGGAKVYRTMVSESGGNLPGAQIPFGLALHLVQRAVATTGQTGRLVPEHMGTLRTLLGPDWPVSPDHPADDLAPSEVPADDALFALWGLPGLRTWVPAEATLTEVTAAVAEALETTLVISEHQRRERLEEILDKAVAREVTGLSAQRWAERLLDLAWVMHENQHATEAAQLLAVRQQLDRAESTSGLVFFRQLVGRLLIERLPPGLAADLIPGLGREGIDGEAPETGQTDPGGVVWTPDRPTEPPKGGAGGLIIP